MTRGHTAILLNNIWGSCNKKLCSIMETQNGSVFHGLSQDAKVFGCPCNSWPSGLSGNARLWRGAFSGVPGMLASPTCLRQRAGYQFCFLSNDGSWCTTGKEAGKLAKWSVPP